MNVHFPYSIRYSPRRGAAGHGFCIYLESEFVSLAQKLELPWDDLTSEWRDALFLFEFPEPPRDFIGHDGGLLTHIHLPSRSASGMSLEKASEPVYVPHNIDTLEQTCALLAIMTSYLPLADARLRP